MTSWQIYLITRLDMVVWAMASVAIVLTAGFCIMGFMCLVERTLDRAAALPGTLRPVMRRIAVALAVLWPLVMLVPDTKDAAAMVIIPRIMESEIVRDFPEWARPLLERSIDKEKRE